MAASIHRVFHADWFCEPNSGAPSHSRHFIRDGVHNWRLNAWSYGLWAPPAANAWAYHARTHLIPDADHELVIEITMEGLDGGFVGGCYFCHDTVGSDPYTNGNGYAIAQSGPDLEIWEVVAGTNNKRDETAYATGPGGTMNYYYATMTYAGVISAGASQVSMAAAKADLGRVTWASGDVGASGICFYLWSNIASRTYWHEIQLYLSEEPGVFACVVNHMLTRGASTFDATVIRNPDTGTTHWRIGDGVRIYGEDSAGNDVQQFEGYLEEVVKTSRYGTGMAQRMKGRDFRGEMLDRLIYFDFIAYPYHAIFDHIIKNYSSHLTWDGSVQAAAGVISRDFRERNCYEAILDLAEENGFYIWQDMQRRLWVGDTFIDRTGAVLFTTDAVGGRVLSNEVPISMHQLVNQVKVYGDDLAGPPQIQAIRDDINSIAKYQTRDYLIVDRKIQTIAECQARADYFCDRYKNQVQHMSIDMHGYEDVFPGDIVAVTSSMQNLNADAFLVLSAMYDLMSEVHHFELVKGTAGAPATANEIHRKDMATIHHEMSERASRIETHRVV